MAVPAARLAAMALVALSAAVLAGCDKKLTGPDEFTVVQRAPLSVPPDFGLRPPRPGEKRPNEVEPRESARAAMLGGQTSSAGGLSLSLAGQSGAGQPGAGQPVAGGENGLSAGERALLEHADALGVDSDIRTVIARENGRVEEEPSLVDRLVFWNTAGEKPAVVDSAAEAQRLRENSALGRPPTAGDTPVQPR